MRPVPQSSPTIAPLVLVLVSVSALELALRRQLVPVLVPVSVLVWERELESGLPGSRTYWSQWIRVDRQPELSGQLRQ